MNVRIWPLVVALAVALVLFVAIADWPSGGGHAADDYCPIPQLLARAEERYQNLTDEERERLIPIYKEACKVHNAAAENLDPEKYFDSIAKLYKDQIGIVGGDGTSHFRQFHVALVFRVLLTDREIADMSEALQLYDTPSGEVWLEQLELSKECPEQYDVAMSNLSYARQVGDSGAKWLADEMGRFENTNDSLIAAYRKSGLMDAVLVNTLSEQAKLLDMMRALAHSLGEALRTNHPLLQAYAPGKPCPTLQSAFRSQ